MFGDKSAWGVTDYLLAMAVDAINIGNWQRQGNNHAKRPALVPRPQDNSLAPEPKEHDSASVLSVEESGVCKGQTISISELNEMLGWRAESKE